MVKIMGKRRVRGEATLIIVAVEVRVIATLRDGSLLNLN